MLWGTLICCLVLAGTVSAEAWEPKCQYLYDVVIRTRTAHPTVAQVFTGSDIKIKYAVTPFSAFEYTAKIVSALDGSFKPIHMSGGWAATVPEKYIEWQPIQHISGKTVHVKLNQNGTISAMYFEKGVKEWEKNMTMGIVQNMVLQQPQRDAIAITDNDSELSAYNVKEKNLVGNCDVLYVNSKLSAAEALHEQYPVHGADLKNHMVITKSWNLTNCKTIENFAAGFSAANEAYPVNHTLHARILIEGDTNSFFNIKDVEANSSLLVAPQLYNKQKAMVATNLRIKLVSKTRNVTPQPKPQDPEDSENAVPEQPQGYQAYMKDAAYVSAFRSRMQRGSQLIREDYGSNLTTVYSWANNGERVGDGLGRNISEFVAELVQGMSTEQPALGLSIVIIKHVRTMTAEEMIATYNILLQGGQHSQNKRFGKIFVNLVALGGTRNTLKVLLALFEKKAITINEFRNHIFMQRAVVYPNIFYLTALQEIALKVEKMQHADQQELRRLRETVSWTYTYILGNAIEGDERQYKELVDNVEKYYIPLLEKAIIAQNYEEVNWRIASLVNVPTKSILEKIYKIITTNSKLADLARPAFNAFWVNQRYPKSMNKFWWSIFINPSVPHKLRCQAVPNIMQSNPPAWMLQHMVEITNNETNPHLIAQVSTAIESAAQLEDPYNQKLVRYARAAKPLLKPWVQDASYSASNFHSYSIENTDLSYTQLLSYIGSQDNLLPSAFQYLVRKDYNGYRPATWQISGSVTSINDTLAVIRDELFRNLNLIPFNMDIPTEPFPRIFVERRQKLEGSLNIPGYGSVYFDKQILQKKLREIFGSFDGSTKKLDTNSISTASELIYSVPNGIGQKFIYTYWSVYFNSIKGSVKLQKKIQGAVTSGSSIPLPAVSSVTLKAEGNLDVTFKIREETKIGFITPWNAMDYISGIDTKRQVHVPVNGSLEVEFNGKLNTIRVGSDLSLSKTNPVQIFKHSSKPYATKIWLLGDKTTVTDSQNTTLLHTKSPITSNTKFGKESTGMVFRVDYSSEIDASYAQIGGEVPNFVNSRSWWSAVYRWLRQQYMGYDVPSVIHFPFVTRDIHISSLNVTYDAPESTAHRAQFNWRIGEFPKPTGVDKGFFRPQQYRQHPRSLELPSSLECDPETQPPAPGTSLRQFIWNATFLGKTVAEFGVYGDVHSNVMNQSISSTAQLWSKPAVNQQFHADLALSWEVPQVNLLNFKKALAESPDSTIEARLIMKRPQWSKPAQVILTSNLVRTDERQEYIRNSPMGQACLVQMRSGQNLQPTCQNVTNWANELDAFDVNIRYSDIPAEIKRAVYAVYSRVRHDLYSYVDEEINFNEKQRPQTISAGLYINKQSTAFSVIMESNLVNATVTNHPLPSWARPIIPNAGKSLRDRVGQYIYPQNYISSFIWDDGHIVTFDGQRYPMQESPCWFIAVAYAPKWEEHAPVDEEQVYRYKELRNYVLIRRLPGRFVETRIHNYNLVVELRGQPNTPTPKIYVKGRVVKLVPGEVTPIGEGAVMYLMQDGAVSVNFNDSHISAINQDSHHVQVMTNQIMMDSAVGLGGNRNGNPYDDYRAPEGCVRADSEAFQVQWADCKLPSKESKCVFIHNNTVQHSHQVVQSQEINSPSGNLPSYFFDDFDSSSESSESEAAAFYSPDAKSFLGLEGHLGGDIGASLSGAGTGSQFSLSGAIPEVLHHTVVYSNDVKHLKGFTCYGTIPICKRGLVPKIVKTREFPYSCKPNTQIPDIYYGSAETKSKIQYLTVTVPEECY